MRRSPTGLSGHRLTTASALARHPVQRASNVVAADFQDVGLDHRGGDVRVTEEVLHRTDVGTRSQQVRRKYMPWRVWRCRLGDARGIDGALELWWYMWCRRTTSLTGSV